MSQFNRRFFITGAAAAAGLGLAGCVGSQNQMAAAVPASGSPGSPNAQAVADAGLESGSVDYRAMYAAIPDGQFTVPATSLSDINPAFLRKRVAYVTSDGPGHDRRRSRKPLSFITSKAAARPCVMASESAARVLLGRARPGSKTNRNGRIGIRRRRCLIGRARPQEGDGRASKRHWHAWRPDNPLGARAMYLWQGNQDTLFRIHGTNEPKTIGTSGSSGCIRMVNQDAVTRRRSPGLRLSCSAISECRPRPRLRVPEANESG